MMVFGLSLTILADEKSKEEELAIGADLRKAKEAYREAFEKANEALIMDFVAIEKRLTENPKLKADEKIKRIEVLKEEQKAFETEARMPKSPDLKFAVNEYKTKVASAPAKCEKAFDLAAEKYVKTDLAAAKAILAEKARLMQGLPEKPDTRKRWQHEKGGFTEIKEGMWEEKTSIGKKFQFKEIAR